MWHHAEGLLCSERAPLVFLLVTLVLGKGFNSPRCSLLSGLCLRSPVALTFCPMESY